MEFNILSAIADAYQVFLNSSFLYYVKILSAFVTMILLIDVVLLLARRVRTDMRITLYGSGSARFNKSKYNPLWDSIQKRLAEKSIASAKIALIEANKLLDEALTKLKYKGETTEEKIGAVPSGKLTGIDEVRQVHGLYKNIIGDPTHEAAFDEIKNAVEAYGRVLRGVRMID